MARTKQLRINDSALIRKHMGEFVGKKINIVLQDQRVIVGKLKLVTDNAFVLTNMRSKSTEYLFQQLSEVYIDSLV